MVWVILAGVVLTVVGIVFYLYNCVRNVMDNDSLMGLWEEGEDESESKKGER